MLFAAVLPLSLLIGGGAIDFLRIVQMKSKLQSIADIIALSTAREFTMGDKRSVDLEAVAKSYFRANADGSLADAKLDVVANTQTKKIRISLSLVPKTLFPTPFKLNEITQISTAEVVGSVPLCVLALNGSKNGTIRLQLNAKLSGMDCGIYSNSTTSDGVTVAAGATLSGGVVCSAGGGSGDVNPELMVDCPVLTDLLSARPPPKVSGCDETDKLIGVESKLLVELASSRLGQAFAIGIEVIGETHTTSTEASEPQPPLEEVDRDAVVTLRPGVYCGGLQIGAFADVELEPGIYIMKDGPLHVDGSARLAGKNVGFYLTGEKSTMFLGPKTSISLTAPRDGDLAGILFFEDRTSSSGRLFSILSDDARVLTGTVYFSKATLVIDADRPIADQSAYTAIIAREISLYAGPHLILNSNYSETDIPAPASAPNGGQIRLID